MTILSTGTLSNSPFTSNDLFIPFKIFARMLQTSSNPFAGNRWERIRAEEKTANLIEGSLLDLVRNGRSSTDESDDYEFEFAFPVAFTRQFGNEPSRITIVGHLRGDRKTLVNSAGDTEPPKKIADDVNQINASESLSGQGAFNAANLKPNDVVVSLANELLDLFSNPSEIPFIDRVEVMSVEIFGIPYGRRGRHF